MNPNFVTYRDEEERLWLLVRLPGDEDFYTWGKITEPQKSQLVEAGVFGLTDTDDAP